jgi:2-dehydro-3-deoxygluconokinase
MSIDATLDVLTVGETMAALRATGPIRLGAPMQLSIAGAESTVAIGLARLGHRAGWVGRVGADEFGQLVLRTLRAEQVDITHAQIDRDGRATGLLARETIVGGITRVTYHRAGSAGSAIRTADIVPALRPTIRILHLTGITPALGRDAADAVFTAAQSARALGVTVCFDVNYRSQLWPADQARETLLPIVRYADILFASHNELPLIADEPYLDEQDMLCAVRARGTREVVVTRGGDGASASTVDGTVTVPATVVPVVDVVGAGDSFVAGYLSGLLDGLDVRGRLQRAAAVSAFSVATNGDWEGLPTRPDLALLDRPSGTTLR